MSTKTQYDALFLNKESLGASFASPTIQMRDHQTLVIEMSWGNGDGPVGTIQLQESASGNSWFDLGPSTNTNSDTSLQVKVDRAINRFYRILYTRSSGGDGDTLSAVYFAKEGV